MNKEHIYILIPCLNEERNIESTVKSVMNTMLTLVDELNFTIILIDDGSTDGTLLKMEQLKEENSYCKVIKNHRNLGLGRTVLNTINELPDEAWVTVTPGDNEFIFDSLRNHLKVRNEYDLILGYVDNELIRPLIRRLASSMFTKTIQFLYGFHFRYINGFKLYRAHVFKDIEIISSGHAFNAELIAKAKLRNPFIRIGESPFLARGRNTGNSKAFSVKSIFRAISEVFRGYRSVNQFRKKVIESQDY
ncbi:glycosyltransferase family 2 protein [Aliikangiella sp. G2MR2-5]|uniref:glycosyltransferase family 2 protein n=1 Tax=Aliikangiella sp. G2MR2-5 TaxID=2788943 RepID=UPI0018AB0C9C|nr:glycosyltransferase family 2 protein [Aliikangiella sp. G2MR2-5]